MNFEHGRGTTVLTDKGYVRGFKNDGVYHFFGLDYAKAKRFMPPEECDPWDDVKEATCYGYISIPLVPYHLGNHLKNTHRYWPQSEDCLNLNVWTRDIDETKKKPVVVWFHGGGFFYGSAIEHLGYEGFNLAKDYDLVVVTINHRIGLSGYMDLRQYGGKYARSVNAGNLDLVEALKWVHRNIAKFGGDPDNVTIFGQSGGGGKVYSVMNMPAADGLYHRAYIMSGVGSASRALEAPDVTELVAKSLAKMGITKDNIEDIETCDLVELSTAYRETYKEMYGPGFPNIGPRPNEDYIGEPYVVGFNEYAKKCPLVVGSLFAEMKRLNPKYVRYAMSDEEMIKAVETELGKEKADEVIPLFRKAYPEKKIIDILTFSTSGRQAGLDFLHKRLEEGCVDNYNYFFTPVTLIEEGQTPIHSYDCSFPFHNTALIPSDDFGGDIRERLDHQVAGRFANYARYGSPQLPGEPEWKPIEKGKDYTIVYDYETRVECNFDKELMEKLGIQ
jgi:para-nitrobenzyl esterase